MSFNPKNLSYASNEPAFLRRLREEHKNNDSSRHERPQARPTKQVGEDEKEDQPIYVIEGSQDTLSEIEYEALIAANLGGQQIANPVAAPVDIGDGVKEADLGITETSSKAALAKKQVASIGESTKRRLPKIVGEEDEEEEDDDEPGHKQSNLRKQHPKIAARKRKMVKLSFDGEGAEA